MIVAAPVELTLKDGVFSCRVDSETLEVCDEDQPEDAIEVTASSPTINTIAVTVPIRLRISDSTLVPFAIDIGHVSVYSTSERSYMSSRMVVIHFLFSMSNRIQWSHRHQISLSGQEIVVEPVYRCDYLWYYRRIEQRVLHQTCMCSHAMGLRVFGWVNLEGHAF